jgi:hypothetical protein
LEVAVERQSITIYSKKQGYRGRIFPRSLKYFLSGKEGVEVIEK